MSLIVSEVYDALIEAGATKEKARAAAEVIPHFELLATKDDIARLEHATKDDIARLEKGTKEDIARLDKKVAVLNLAVLVLGPAIVALLTKLVFFP
ncbi:MAG: hypothetical protein OXU75_05970 [Deltaproteobacteria bacterium]|nr:hypothetical protein [Deltaproteobacteria bacterium]